MSQVKQAGAKSPAAIDRKRNVEMAKVGSMESLELAPSPQSMALSKSATALPAAYLSYLSSLRAAWGDLPDLTITYRDFGLTVRAPRAGSTPAIPDLLSWFTGSMAQLNPFRADNSTTFRPLQSASGMVRPGELTLVLAPPGHGKSVLLKGLAGRLEREPENLRGEVRWNGLTAAESAAAGVHLTKMCAFVEQGDAHYPMLTVRETFRFALENSNADTTLLGSPEFTAMQEKKVELMLELLGLKECADTIVGNAMMRGISGGQKKRVTLGEMMITQARALFLDEISTGLDSAATFDIVSALRAWTRVLNGSAYVALLQPAPEVVALFDQLVLLREGCIVFSGTQAQLRSHLASLNITPDPEVDFADWIVDFLTDPPAIWQRDIERRGHVNPVRSFREDHQTDEPFAHPHSLPQTEDHGANAAAALTVPGTDSAPPVASNNYRESDKVIFHMDQDGTTDATASTLVKVAAAPVANAAVPRPKNFGGQVVSAAGVPLTTGALKRAYESTPEFRQLSAEISDDNFTRDRKRQNEVADGAKQPSAFTARQYHQAYSRSLSQQLLACLWREWLFLSRSPSYVLPRLFQAVAKGFIQGSVFYRLGTDATDLLPRLGLMWLALVVNPFAAMGEIGLASEFKLIVYKQIDAGFYSPIAYILSVVLMTFPLSVAETLAITLCDYFMAEYADSAGRFFFFSLMVMIVNLCFIAIFRWLSYSKANAVVASTLAVPIIGVCILFSGFLITHGNIPDWLIWVFWLSPVSWAFRSLALNEFKSNRYAPGVGDAHLETWQIDTNDEYKWAGFGYVLGVTILFIVLGAVAVARQRFALTTGTRRVHSKDDDESLASLVVRVGVRSSSMMVTAEEQQLAADGSQIQFPKMDLTFRDLTYTVTVNEKNDDTGKYETRRRQLLTGINGYVRAGELTALMGSSGAGKTTLMDVIAGRKTAGTIEGEILVDGRPQTFPAFNRLMGYCEQVDIHVPTATVREAIEFSAQLRLPSAISDESRKQFVVQILEDLELAPIAGRMVRGLSPGQMKLLTIGVELAANPTFLFLDEPTSGLDSRAALIVCRVIRKISRRGRAVLCTIHQPSADLFGMFDRLLLLKAGGRESYFGPIGEDGISVVEYFMNAEIGEEFYRPSPPDNVNPASWMLDVIGAGTSAKGKIADYPAVYAASTLRAANMETVRLLSEPRAADTSTDSSLYAASPLVQLRTVVQRHARFYWRNVDSNSTRLEMMLFLGMTFGLIWRDIDDSDEAGMNSKLAVIMMGLGWIGFNQSANVMPLMFHLRAIFYRERAANTYAPWVFSASIVLVELPFLFALTFIFTTPMYFLVHFQYSGAMFFQYVLVMYLTAIFFACFGLMLGALMPNWTVASLAHGFLVALFFLFGGAFIQKNSLPIGWYFAYYLDPMSKGAVAIGIHQYVHCSEPDSNCPSFYSSTMGRTVTQWEFVQHYLASGENYDKYYLGWLVLSIFVVLLVFVFAVQKVAHVNR